MNDNQKRLYNALKTIIDGRLILEDTFLDDEITNKEIKEVIAKLAGKFTENITEFDVQDLYGEVASFDYYANGIIEYVIDALKREDEE